MNIESSYGKTNKKIYDELTSDSPIDLVRYQVANCYMGRCGLINSGGESKGASDMADAVRTAVINKRGGGTGLISGRKAFQRPMAEGVELLPVVALLFFDKTPGVELPGVLAEARDAAVMEVAAKVRITTEFAKFRAGH